MTHCDNCKHSEGWHSQDGHCHYREEVGDNPFYDYHECLCSEYKDAEDDDIPY